MYNPGKCPILKGFPTSFHSLGALQYKILKTQDKTDYLLKIINYANHNYKHT